MRERLKTIAVVAGYALLGGALLAMFVLVQSMLRFVFSLIALWLGVRFFRSHESLWRRIGFVVSALVFFFLIVLFVTMVMFIRDGMPTAP
ncbi:hypothetical protein ACTHPH_03895 [Paenibacillus pasadenensis]|uniref:Uncharacterized protein n=1 Tax=Paenibacillus pasadenensis TaxID=217090 RepID=A0A2N5N7M3_9BACL|nr:hypothetical protein [Paenibacillus pasadenensis]PLT46325.1 hypothetical protein B8V81_4756 [Paenibacillus pasadenensis]